MSLPRPPAPAKLVIGILLKERALFAELARRLSACFGPPDLISPWIPFGYTAYYEKEMGAPLVRRVLAFSGLIDQDGLAAIKRMTNSLEEAYRAEQGRRANIDPGYLLLERFVLATGKNFSHRIYIGAGIYADLTLVFRKGGFQPLPWTYPDYADRPLSDFLVRVRRRYAADLKALPGEAEKGGALRHD
ncbi:MAG: DUF4416 family protein [Desulfobacteraceae bacterium]|nr:MAG: DUF4416 family protein [Desulfobacteraceae bacterium]